MTYLLSVIIPTYNAENSIIHAIKSLQNQTIGFENIELVIVDDNSKDMTEEILKNLSQEYKNINCIFNKTNSGSAGRGRNIGIRESSSEYIMFLDQDDFYVENMCEVLLQHIRENNLEIVLCKHKSILNNQIFDIGEFKQNYSFIKANPKENKEIFNDIYMWDKIFDKDFLIRNDIKCPENYLSEDMVFVIKAYLKTYEIGYLENFYGYVYNIRDSKEDSSTINSINKNRYLKLLKGFEKTIELLKQENKENLIICLMEEHFTSLISLFIKLDADYSSKIDILEKIYEFKKFIGINFTLNEKWADIINKNIERRNFRLIIFLSLILKQMYRFNGLRGVYRNFYNKTN